MSEEMKETEGVIYNFDSLKQALMDERIDDFREEVRRRPELLTSGLDEHGESLLEIVISYSPEDRMLEIMTWLLDMGADPNHRHSEGASPLWEAALNWWTDIVELLLSRGADPNTLLFDDEDDPVTVLVTVEFDFPWVQRYLEDARSALEKYDCQASQEDFDKWSLAVQELPKIIRLLEEYGAKPLDELLEE